MRPLIYGLILAAIVGIQSCNNAGSLARNIAGSWTTSPEALDLVDVNSSTAVYTYDFTNEDGTNGGTVALTAMLSASIPVNPSVDTIPALLSVSVAGVATIQGTWRATGDDEIFLMLDPQTITVSVDPQAVELSDNSLLSTLVPVMETLQTSVAADMKARFTSAFEKKVLTVHHLDDVEIHGGIMKWEVGDVETTLSSSTM